MRLLYSTLLYLLMPLMLLHLAWRGFRQHGYWRRIHQRFGLVRRQPHGIAVWVHAVSVGESLAALPLVRRLLERYPPQSVLVTTTTPAGSERVQAAFGDRVVHAYAPYDLPGAVNRFLRRVQPRRVIVMETELWPNLFHALARRRVPIVIANARLSPRSMGRYRRIRALTAEALSHCTAVAAQSEADAGRFRSLGADPARVHVLGNLKFDLEMPEDMVAAGRVLRTRWGEARPVWIAASNPSVLPTWTIWQALLILVPRHPQRFDAVARLASDSGLHSVRRSAITVAAAADSRPAPAPGEAQALTQAQVLVGDSMGELPMYFGAADVAFVGGSLVEVGGHNVLEPAALGLPVLFGPYMFNFEQARALLLEHQAAREIEGLLQLEPAVSRLFQDPQQRAAMGKAGREVLQANRGALQRLLNLIENS